MGRGFRDGMSVLRSKLYLSDVCSCTAKRAQHFKHSGLLKTNQRSLCHYLKIYLLSTLVASCWNEEITLVAGSEY